jgi:hypothetical protein
MACTPVIPERAASQNTSFSLRPTAETLSEAEGKEPKSGEAHTYPAPAPYVHPIPPKVTESTQESAEGRKLKTLRGAKTAAPQTVIVSKRA